MVRRGRPIGGVAAFDRDMDDFGDRENADLRRQVEYLTRQVAKLTTDKRNVEVESDDNPFGEDPNQGVQHDRRWEIGFRVDVPDFDARQHDEEDDNTVSPFGEDPERGVYQDRRWELGFRVDIPDFDGGLRAEEWHYETMYGEPNYDEYPDDDVLCGLTVNSPVQASKGIDNGTEEVRYGPAYDDPIFDEYPEEEILDGKNPFMHQSGSNSGEEECSHGEEDEEVEADHDGIDGKVESEGEAEGLGDANTGNGDSGGARKKIEGGHQTSLHGLKPIDPKEVGLSLGGSFALILMRSDICIDQD